jgi:Bacterial SH3 domain
MRGARSLTVCLALTAGLAAGEPLYVVEQLVVNVMSAPDASGERIATLKSGDAVELIERQGETLHVRLPGGKDGWLRAGYLSAQPPLRLQLQQRDAEVAQLKEQVSQLQQRATAAPAAPRPATTPAPAAEDAARAPAAGLMESARPAAARAQWPWTLGAAGGGLIVGFAAGMLLLDRHIRRKYGGLRIY